MAAPLILMIGVPYNIEIVLNIQLYNDKNVVHAAIAVVCPKRIDIFFISDNIMIVKCLGI